ncbi:MAG: cupredoxin family copper-binding protein [Steroidobacteraceae bacterium]
MRLVTGALLALSLAASAAASPRTTTHTVTIEGMQFSPPELTVHRGDRIVWVNKDLFPHTVTAAGKSFDSGSIAAGASWSYVAATSGDYAYGCTFHPTMQGRLTVQ